jgi:hypothetical protein
VKPFVRTLCILSLTTFGVACGGNGSGSGSGGTDPPPLVDQAIGGAWLGTDGSGHEILALSTESGRVRWVIPSTGEQGFGTGSVSGTAVTINYTYVAPLGFTLADGSSSATCAATGTIQARQTLAVTTNCITTLGGTFNSSASLSYDSGYDVDSSLSAIAGNYDDFGVVLNVAGNGVVFEQDPGTGCVVNGQVSIIDSQFNAYDVSITYSSCLGNFAILNGATFTGIGYINNTVTPEQVTVGLTGAVSGVTYSLVFTVARI